MNKIILILLFSVAITTTYAQQAKTLKTQPSLKSATVNQGDYPKLSLNNNKCTLKNLTVGPAKTDGYQVTVNFTNTCAKREMATIGFDELAEALQFKDILLNDYNYDMIHLEIDRQDKTSFWIDYSFPKTRNTQLR